MVKFALGYEPVVGSLTSLKEREYKVTHKLQEGKCLLYTVTFPPSWKLIDGLRHGTFAGWRTKAMEE